MNSQKFLGEFIDLYGYQEFGNLITENYQDRLVESNNHYADTQYIFMMESVRLAVKLEIKPAEMSY